MPTSKIDRLNKLFEDGKRLAKPDPQKPHIADLDFLPKRPPQKQAVTQYPEKVNPQVPRPGQDVDLLATADNDGHASASSGQPTVKKPPIKSPPRGKPRGGKHQGQPWGRTHFATTANELPKHDIEGNTLTGHFCPLMLVAKFPYKYMADTDDRVSKYFFAQNKFYQREWHIYYIDPPTSLMAKPILLLPLEQVKYLIQQINEVFKMDVVCPPDPFTVSFFDDGTPQPMHLGISYSRDDLAQMEAYISARPDNSDEDAEDLALDDSGGYPPSGANSRGSSMHIARQPTERSVAEFKEKMERILATKRKNKQAAQQKKKEDQLRQQHDWAKQLKQAQCYFGLRSLVTKLPMLHKASSWSEQQERHCQGQRASNTFLHPLDVSKPAPYVFECNPIIVCIDFEAYERDHSRITEVGVSTLDTLDLVRMAPGEGGENWIEHIRSRHFRIQGREHLVNKDFCPGNASNFRFGTTEWVKLDAAAEAVDQCFAYPFSAQFKYKEENGAQRSGVPLLPSGPDAQKGPKKRNVVILGHDIRNELGYLKILGSQVFNPALSAYSGSVTEINVEGPDRDETLSTVIEVLDTGVLYRVLAKETQNASLGKMMLALGRRALHLHNAGNDARYTLEALIALLIKARALEDEATLNEEAKPSTVPHDGARDLRASSQDEVRQRVIEKTDVMEPEVRDTCKPLERTLHTMTITDKSGKEIEVEDPWLMAQESDGEGDRSEQVSEEVGGANITIYRDPAVTGGRYQVIGSTDDLDDGEADGGGLAETAGPGAIFTRRGERHGKERMPS